MKIKICGLTNKDDATWAINYGADFLGINLYKESPRHVTAASASQWISQLPSFATTVGVFVDADQKDIMNSVVRLNLKGVQLHGEESPEKVKALRTVLQGLGRPIFIIKAFHMKNEESLSQLPLFSETVDYFLLDSFVEGELGGTGARFNWNLALQAKELGKPIFLAGGLNPENVKEAVKKVAPFAVDVASGVEKSPRKKDQKKIQDFILNAKA